MFEFVAVVQSLIHVWLFGTMWTAARQAFPSFIIPHRVSSNSCPLNRCCHPTISSSVALFSFCLQSFSASGYFAMHQLVASGGQSVGASASASVLPKNFQCLFPLRLTDLILPSEGLSRVFSSTRIWKHQFFRGLPCLLFSSHIHTWLYELLSAKWCLCFWTHCVGLS